MSLPNLFIATRNTHKTAELRALLAQHYHVRDAHDQPDLPEIAETGTTFLENATLKAVGISQHLPDLVLADDSGLEVDALGGRPGVWSSSFGGVEGDHARNNQQLLTELRHTTPPERTARFRCTLVAARQGQRLAYFTGTVEGEITTEPAGEHGFGYDPLFQPTGYQDTFAQLGPEVKNQLSHRARALQQALPWLLQHGPPQEK